MVITSPFRAASRAHRFSLALALIVSSLTLDDFDAHLASTHFKKLIASIRPWLAEPPQIATYEELV